jgi:hypothetical protein
VFADALPDGCGGWYAHYEHARPDAPGWAACDVRATVGAHQDAWLDDLDAWHGALCEVGARCSPDFWLTSISRLNIWTQETVLKPLFFAAGLCQWAAVHPEAERIVVLRAPAEVDAYVGEFTKHVAARPARAAWTRATVTGLAAMARRLTGLARHARRRPAPTRARVLLYSQVVDGQALEEVGDHFFGRFVDDLVHDLAADFTVTYLLRDQSERARVERSLGARGSRTFFLLDYVSAADVARVAVRTVRACVALASLPRRVPPLTIGPHTSRSFIGRYLAAEVLRRMPDVEIAVEIAMRRAVSATGAATMLYPYEEKGLERALLRARGGAAHRVRALGFGHAAHTRCHLALRTRRGRVVAPAPDGILATGARAARFLVEWARKDAPRVTAVGSPRHMAPLPPMRPRVERARGLRILIVIAHASELDALGAWLERVPALFEGHEVAIRTYRFGWFTEQDRGLRRVLAAAPALATREGSLREQLAWCDLTVFNSTTTGVQAMLAGRLVAHAALHDLFAMDPLLGEPGAFARCAEPADLGAALARARAMDDAEVAAVIAAQRRLASEILAPPDPAALVSVVRGGEAPAMAGAGSRTVSTATRGGE